MGRLTHDPDVLRALPRPRYMGSLAKRLIDCRRKVSFPSRTQADKAAAKMQDQHGDVTRSYRCDLCRRWHLTTTYRVEHEEVAGEQV